MLDSVFNFLFRCQHRKLSRPMTPTGSRRKDAPPTIVVCLDCGKHFAYDWKRMRITGRALEDAGSPRDTV